MILSDGPPKAVDRIGKGKRIGIDIGRRRHCADGAERVAQHSVLKRAVSTRERRILLGHSIGVISVVKHAVGAPDCRSPVSSDVPGKTEPRCKVISIGQVQSSRNVSGKQHSGRRVGVPLGMGRRIGADGVDLVVFGDPGVGNLVTQADV